MRTPDNKLRYRYPGTKPFNEDEARLFNGRDADISNLCDLIAVHNLIVLYGRSGLGKSSLLNAGVMTRFSKEPNIDTLFTRFGANFEEGHISPLQRLEANLKETVGDTSKTFLSEKFNANDAGSGNNLWYLIKNRQLADPTKDTFVLIFDQFEEIFTYPEEELSEFKKQLSELLFVKVPQNIRNVVKENLMANNDFLTKEETAALFAPLNIKILFSLRSDKLSLLNKFTNYFPAILQTCYELNPLNDRQARDAIEMPAKLAGTDFISAPFTYTHDALDLIVSSLLSGKKAHTDAGSKNEIETFQLQIVCKFAEDLVIEHRRTNITTDDLGNIKEIFENHYRNIIKKLTEKDQLPARILMEEKLIIDRMRVSMPIPFIMRDPGMTRELLDELINTHIIRPEQNNTIEISHDTLIDPILKYYEERKKQETLDFELKQKEEQITKIKQDQAIQLKRQEEKQALEVEKLKAKRTKLVTYFVLSVTLALICLLGYNQHIGLLKSIAFDYYKMARITALHDPTKALAYADSAIFFVPRSDVHSYYDITHGDSELIKKNVFYRNILVTTPKDFISVSDNGKYIITGTASGEISVLGTEDSTKKRFNQKMSLLSAGFAADCQKVLLGTTNGLAMLWHINTDKYTLLGNFGDSVTTSAISPDGQRMIIGTKDGIIKILDSTGKFLYQLAGNSYTCAIFSPDSKKVLAGGTDGSVVLYDSSGRRIRRYENYDLPITCLCFTPRGLLFASGSKSGFVNIWHISDTTRPRVAFGGTIPVTDVCFVNVQKEAKYHLVCVAYDAPNKIDLWHVNHTKVESNIDSMGFPMVRDMPVYWYRKENDLLGHTKKATCIRKLVGDKIVTASDDGTAKLWYWKTKKDTAGIND